MSSAFLGIHFDELQVIPHLFDEIVETINEKLRRMKTFAIEHCRTLDPSHS